MGAHVVQEWSRQKHEQPVPLFETPLHHASPLFHVSETLIHLSERVRRDVGVLRDFFEFTKDATRVLVPAGPPVDQTHRRKPERVRVERQRPLEQR